MNGLQELVDEGILTSLSTYEDVDDGKDHKTHMISPEHNKHIWQPGMTTQQIVDIARLTGQEITALCGYVWVPKRNPEKYDVCPACMDIAQKWISEDGE